MATPPCNATAEQRVVLPTLKVTVPVGDANPVTPVTVAVTVAEVPITIGLAETVTAWLVDALVAVPETGMVIVAGLALLVIVTCSLIGWLRVRSATVGTNSILTEQDWPCVNTLLAEQVVPAA